MTLKVTRRHLLKGSLAAPLVMTVRSASATGWAVTSIGACRIRDKDRAYDDHIYKFRPSKDADHWLRCEVQICQIEKKRDGKWEKLSGEYFKGNTDCWWEMKKVGDDCEVYKKSDYTDSNCRIYKKVRKEWGLVACDENGYVKGFAWEHKDCSPITGSCWASLKLT